MMKKMYVVQSDDGEFWCGMNIWDKQLRKAKIFHSLKYAGECCERFKARNPKIVEVSLTIVPEMKTNADRIRAMSDEELSEYLVYHNPYHTESNCLKWLQQEAE